MYGFLILLPLTLISLGIGWLIAMSPQVKDYVEFATDIPNQATLIKQIWVDRRLWAQIGAHMLAYAVLCFVLIATVRTVSAPLPSDRPPLLRAFQLFLEVLFVSLPSTVLLWIVAKALLGPGDNWIHWFVIGVLCVGLLVSIFVTAKRVPLELYNSFAAPHRITKTDIVAVLCVLVIVATGAAFALYPRYSAYLVGMFPVLMLVTAATFLGIAAIFSRHASPVAVISSLVTGVLCLHVFDEVVLPAREFRYQKTAVSSAGGVKPTVEEVKAQRKIPDLATAFHQWLEYRRPAIEAYKSKGKPYPVFIVSAQGGGMYAAYHPALSLARLTDYCPEFAHHLFGISSVSGGSLGAAVYAELMRSLPPAERGDPASPIVGCSRVWTPTVHNVLETKVIRFFQTDFLSPVIASAFLFDVPSALVPQLRYGHDRASALELGFEAAWQDLALSGSDSGMSSNFLGRWNPAVPSPALFLSTTGVNFGIPVLISQIDWSYNPSAGLAKQPTAGVGAALDAKTSALLTTVLDRLARDDDPLRIGIANILDFRPDLQLATSTAVVLSARFPFVTPPATIVKNQQIPPGGIFQKVRELQLTDGGFYDNSGGIVARELVADLSRKLETDHRLKPFNGHITFRVIRFTDRPEKRQALASETAYPEIATPIVAYNAVRLARGVQLPRLPLTEPRTFTRTIYLLDEWYDGTLNWLLSRDTKLKIEQRSSWLKGAGNEVCCEVRLGSGRPERIRLEKADAAELMRADPRLMAEDFIPNAAPFGLVFRDLNPDPQPSSPPPTAATPGATPAAVTPAPAQ